MELAEAVRREGLDTLRLRRRADGYELALAQTFDPGLDWTRFAVDFDSDNVPNLEPRVLGDHAARARLAQVGAGDSLRVLEDLLAAGRHEMFTLRLEPSLGLEVGLYVHSSTLGRGNGMQALRAGGVRVHGLDEPELDVYADGCNLARAMSYKNAAAELPMGGCKLTLRGADVAPDDLPRLGFIARCVEAGRLLTGPDMGFLPAHVDALRAHFTQQCTGGNEGPLGPTGVPTAFGVFLAIREALRHVHGRPDLSGRRVAVQGLGGVGRPLAEQLAAAGAELIVADVDAAAVARFVQGFPEAKVMAPEQILDAEVEVFAPCAKGGFLDEAAIDKLRCKMIFGGANNPLKAFSREGEIRLARRLAERGVLFQIEWLHNTAGVMSGFEEYHHGERATQEHLRPRLERVCKDGTARILAEAKTRGITPTELAYEALEAKIHP